MKYYKSTSGKSYSFNGKIVPANTQKNWLPLEDKEAFEFERNIVIRSLIKAGGIIITDKEPAEMGKTPDALLNTNAKLVLENTELKNRVATLEAREDVGLAAQLKAVQEELAQAKAETAEAKKLFDELKTEAEQKIAELEEQLAAKKAKK